jgi:hypothetical protein
MLKLGLFEGDEESRVEGGNVGSELGAAEILKDADGKLDGPVDDSGEGPEEGTMLQLGMLEGDDEGGVGGDNLGPEELGAVPKH